VFLFVITFLFLGKQNISFLIFSIKNYFFFVIILFFLFIVMNLLFEYFLLKSMSEKTNHIENLKMASKTLDTFAYLLQFIIIIIFGFALLQLKDILDFFSVETEMKYILNMSFYYLFLSVQGTLILVQREQSTIKRKLKTLCSKKDIILCCKT